MTETVTLAIPPKNPPTGTTGMAYQKITPGNELVFAPKEGKGVFEFLDDIGDTIKGGVKDILNSAVREEVNRHTPVGPENVVTTHGDPKDQPRTVPTPPPKTNFFEENKQMILIGGGVLAAVALVVVMSRN